MSISPLGYFKFEDTRIANLERLSVETMQDAEIKGSLFLEGNASKDQMSSAYTMAHKIVEDTVKSTTVFSTNIKKHLGKKETDSLTTRDLQGLAQQIHPKDSARQQMFITRILGAYPPSS